MARFLLHGPVPAPDRLSSDRLPVRMRTLLRTLISVTGSLFLLALTALVLGLSLLLAGCASQDVDAPSPELVKAQRDSLLKHTRPHTFSESPEPYLKGRLVGLRTDPRDHALLRTQVTLKQRGSLKEVAASLARLAPVTALVAGEEAAGLPALSSLPRPMSPSAGAQIPGLEDLVPAALDLDLGLSAGSILDVNYTGTLRGLLDTIAGLSGYGWDFDARTRRITFSSLQVRTFVVAASAGTVVWDSQVSNRSREQQDTSLSGSNINSTVSSGDTTSQTAQVNSTKATLDVWKEVETTVKGLLSKAGTVSISQSAGTLTVRDTHSRLEAIARYIDELNARLERQVALCVRVWALERYFLYNMLRLLFFYLKSRTKLHQGVLGGDIALLGGRHNVGVDGCSDAGISMTKLFGDGGQVPGLSKHSTCDKMPHGIGRHFDPNLDANTLPTI